MNHVGRCPALFVMAATAALVGACGRDEPAQQGRSALEWELLLKNPQTQRDALQQLRAEGADALPVLVQLLRASPRPVLGAAFELLIDLGPRAADAVGPLSAKLDDPDPGTRGLAALALGRVGPKAGPALPRLGELLTDPDERVRVSAAVAMWRIEREGPRALRVMMNALRGEAPNTRAMVVEGLGEFGEAAVDPLIEALADKDSSVRIQAALALGQIGAKAIAARIPLERMRDGDEDPVVRAAALRALQSVPDENKSG